MRSAQDTWEAALGELQIQVSKSNYRTWLERTIGLSYKDNQFVIGVPNTFVAEYLDKNQRSLIEKTIIGLTHQDTEVIFRINGKHPSSSAGQGPREEITTSPRLNLKYTFDSFVVGGNNRLAHTAAMNVAQKPGHSHNPLFIYGGVGLGKTHLLHALGHAALASNIKVLYVTAEQYTNEFVNSIREKKTGEFHNKFRYVDMLLIDDIQFIIGKEQTEESFFHTFNELHNTNHQIAITCDRQPQSMPLLEERLCSRFEWGLTVDIKPPDFETRTAILQAKAQQKVENVTSDALEFIASLPYQNIRQLEGALNRVIAYASLTNSPPSPELAAQALKDIAIEKHKIASITPALIIEVVAENFQLTPQDLQGKKRDRETTLARHLSMHLIRKETNCSLAQIGRELGDRDHSTVIHACENMANTIDTNPYLKQKLLNIQQTIYHGQRGNKYN